jgi:hypothetical protein
VKKVGLDFVFVVVSDAQNPCSLPEPIISITSDSKDSCGAAFPLRMNSATICGVNGLL